ncbi:MAG: sensor histidine kinase, partial [Acetobacteraceae bacterium]
ASLTGRYPQSAYGKNLVADLERGEPLVVADIGSLPHLTAEQRRAYRALDVQSFMVVPLVKDGEYVAGLAVLDGSPRDWKPSERILAEEVAGRGWAAVERARAVRHRRLLLDELNHRVKNTLATVQSMAAQTLAGSPAGAEAVRAFEGRLMGLAKTHSLLTRSEWRSVTLRELLNQELAPFRGKDKLRCVITGDNVAPRPKVALALGMAVHELATNAAKYGALSVADGAVRIASEVCDDDGERRLRIEWRESGGPPVETPARKGFGSRLIESKLAYELDGKTHIDYRPEGIVCTIEIPLGADRGLDGGGG